MWFSDETRHLLFSPSSPSSQQEYESSTESANHSTASVREISTDYTHMSQVGSSQRYDAGNTLTALKPLFEINLPSSKSAISQIFSNLSMKAYMNKFG